MAALPFATGAQLNRVRICVNRRRDTEGRRAGAQFTWVLKCWEKGEGDFLLSPSCVPAEPSDCEPVLKMETNVEAEDQQENGDNRGARALSRAALTAQNCC